MMIEKRTKHCWPHIRMSGSQKMIYNWVNTMKAIWKVVQKCEFGALSIGIYLISNYIIDLTQLLNLTGIPIWGESLLISNHVEHDQYDWKKDVWSRIIISNASVSSSEYSGTMISSDSFTLLLLTHFQPPERSPKRIRTESKHIAKSLFTHRGANVIIYLFDQRN